jgi:hypothetical protein
VTPEHAQARCGNATASEFKCVRAKGEGKTRAAYLRRIVAERLTNKPAETFAGNGHTERGNAQEHEACDEYEARTGEWLETSGFIKHPELAAGCSPDRLIGTDGGAEVKSVIPSIQVETILRGKYPPEHIAQMQGNLWITGRRYWNFISYCPDMLDERLQLYVYRVERDEAYIAELDRDVRAFLAEVDRTVDYLLGRDRTEELLRKSLERAA